MSISLKQSPRRRGGRSADLKLVGQRIRERRIARGLTLTELGKLVGKSAATLSKIETGDQSLDVGTFLDVMEQLGGTASGVLLDLQFDRAESEAQRRAIEVLRHAMRAIEL